jgi:hypothetical protein
VTWSNLVPRIEWSKWHQLSRKDQRHIADQFADAIANAPLEDQARILIAVSKASRAKSKAQKPVAEPLRITSAQQAIIDQHNRENGDVIVQEKLAAFRKRYDRPVRDHWQETRKALLIFAIEEVVALRAKGLPAHLPRRVVSERYRGHSLGISSNTDKQVKLRVSPTVLWKSEKAGAHLEGGSPDALDMDLHLCGRHRKWEGPPQ